MFPPRSTIHVPASRHARRARRLITATAIVAAGALALSGCAGGSSGATTLDKEAKVKLTFWTGQADAAQQIERERAEHDAQLAELTRSTHDGLEGARAEADHAVRAAHRTAQEQLASADEDADRDDQPGGDVGAIAQEQHTGRRHGDRHAGRRNEVSVPSRRR